MDYFGHSIANSLVQMGRFYGFYVNLAKLTIGHRYKPQPDDFHCGGK